MLNTLSLFPHKARCSWGRRPRPSWNGVKTIYCSGDLLERIFLSDPSLTSGISAALMQGHCLRCRPCIKQHMSGGQEFHRKYRRQLPPHLTRHETLHASGLDYCWANVADSGPTFSWHFVRKINEYVGLASHRPELLGFSWSLTSYWDRQASFWLDHATMHA